MGTGYQPSIPLRTDRTYGPYVLAKTFNESVRQDVKMIVLTGKGEKLTDVNFGCGLREFLFEPNNLEPDVDENSLQEEILSQLETYAPYVEVNEVSVNSQEQVLSVIINYTILPTNTTQIDTVEVTL